MVIESASVYNFRSLKSVVKIDLSSGLDVFIGQNDCGKSTLLQGLNIFFDPTAACQLESGNQKNDLSFLAEKHDLEGGVSIEMDEVGILCALKLDEQDLAQASNLVPLAINGRITILKKCANEARYTPAKTAKKEGYFVLTESFKNTDFNGLGSKNEKALIALLEKYPASKEFLVNANDKGKPENPERVGALLANARQTEERELRFELFSFPAKAPFDAVWPEFTLIDTKTPLDGKHKVIDDAFKKIDSKIEKKFESDIGRIKDEAKEEYSLITAKITAYAKKHYIAQLEDFQAIPSVKLSVGRDLVLKRFGQKDLSHFDQQGDGTKRRMMVAILQVSASVLAEIGSEEAKKGAEERGPKAYEPLRIWAFDEPEMHLHPGAQRDLFNSFIRFRQEGFQIICSTHSTVFVNSSDLSSVHLIELDENLCSRRIAKDPQMAELIKDSIGLRNSDVFFSNLFVIVEGATETGALPVLYEHVVGSSPYTHGISIVDGKGCSKSPEKADFFLSNLGETLCLFDNDARAGLGAKAADLESKGIIIFVGTADFEDAFEDIVWLEVLRENFPLGNPENGSDHWTPELITEIRGRISLTDANKKFLKLIESSYHQNIYQWGLHGGGVHPYDFDKVEIGKLIAQKAADLGKVPAAIHTFLELMSQKVD